ncbi:MAG: Ig-like domain-containing protein [bacterium]|nr:Ig-like domain-containing protein [bacterium]
MAGRRLVVRSLLGLTLLWVSCAPLGEAGAPAPSLRFEAVEGNPGSGSLVVTGLPLAELNRLDEASLTVDQWERLLSLRTDPAWPDGPAVLGLYRLDDSRLRFTPRFPLVAGLEYHARFDGGVFDILSGQAGRGTASELLSFSISEPNVVPSARVLAAYPSADEIPENALRLYLEFSAPMAAKQVTTHIHLFDSTGSEVELPFVEIENGLWDARQRRLTLFFHPGRVKRGVGPNLVMGPPIRAGEVYRLVVDRELEDSRGLPLAAGFEKRFRVGPADRQSPDPGRWQLEVPESAEARLAIVFPEPLDRALLLRLLRVAGPDGEAVEGQVVLAEDGTRWSFLPALPWRPGEHSVQVHPGLEDLAGNSIARRFEEREKTAEPTNGDPGARNPIEIPFRPFP